MKNIKKNFGFGMMRLPMLGDTVDFDQVSAMVDDFFARGFNYFDTAHPYIQGRSEEAVKKCLSSRYPRDSYVLVNKLSGSFWEVEADIEPLIQKQLEACGVEYFDILLMHAMNATRHEKYKEQNAYAVAQKLKQEGKIRHVGFSFHDSAEVLDKILTEQPEMEVVQLQFNYADYLDPKVQSKACLEVCRKHGKPVIVMEPVKGGSLANLPGEAVKLMPGGSPASYAIRFAASAPGVMMVLSGMSNTEQMADNLSFMENFQPLTEAEYKIIDQVRTIYQSQHRIPCTACRYCTDGCPANIPIPDLFAWVNGQRGENKPETTYEQVMEQAGMCVKCGQCESICPQTLHIRQLLEAIEKEFSK